MSSREFSVTAEGVRKRYGDKWALDGFDLAVRPGTVCGLLGPNGAGKTTAVRILATLTRLDEGSARVAGHDVSTEAATVRFHIGLVGQNAAVDEVLSGEQNLTMFGRLFHLSPPDSRRRAAELLDRFGLAEAGRKPVRSYSGGMRRRLDLAASMILAPAVLFLDEPTVGLDPRGRNEVWQAVRALVGQGTTVLLTTQYLDEADQLAAEISVMDHGRVIATGSPGELKSRIGGDRIDVVLHDPHDLGTAVRVLARLAVAPPAVDEDARLVSVRVADPARALQEVVRTLDDARVPVDDLALRRPTLDEAFLHLTGRRADAPADEEVSV